MYNNQNVQSQNIQNDKGISSFKNVFIATFTGRLSKDATPNDSQKGYHYVNLNILSNVVPQPSGGFRPIAVQVRVFAPQVKFAETLKKGDKVLVTGTVTDLRHWVAKNGSGQIHTCVNVNASEVELQARSKSGQQTAQAPVPQQYVAPAQQAMPQQYVAPAQQAMPQQYAAPAQTAPQQYVPQQPQYAAPAPQPAPQHAPQSVAPFTFDEGEAPMAF